MGLFSKTIPVNKDTAKIRELLSRGVERVFPNADFVEKRLSSGERLTVYLGIDPTGPTLHIGHLIPLLKLRQFQDLGHKVILLIGDFTATIGDPTDKMAARVLLSEKQVLENAKQYKKQISPALTFGGGNPAKMKYNSSWLKKLSMAEIVTLLAHITYAQTIKRDMFQQRIADGKDLYVNEFLYPVLQGYDSVAMEVDGEIGGSDQTFNMLMGRDLLKRMKNKEKFVIAMKLLADPTGKKMGKTEGNMVTLSDEPADMFGKIMSWSDEMIFQGFELCTTVPLTDIERMKKELETGVNPKELKLKLKLAEEIVSLLHGAAEAKRARVSFKEIFSERGIPEDVAAVKATEHELLIDVSLKSPAQIISSKTEFRRLAAENAITHLESGEKVKDGTFPAKAGTYRFGKHRFLKVECM